MPDGLSKRRPLPEWQYAYPDSRTEYIKELEEEVEFLADQLSCLLDHATNGLLSKTNYTKAVMYAAVDDAVMDDCERAVEEETAELRTALIEANDEAALMRDLYLSEFGTHLPTVFTWPTTKETTC